jgi:hypothetical protein
MVVAFFATVVLTVLANATETEQGMYDVTQELVVETRHLVYATVFSGIAVAGVGGYIGIRQIIMQRRQHELEIRKRMQEVTSEIDSERMQDLKKTIYDWYCRLKMRRQPIIFDHTPALRKAADMMEIAYDRLAAEVMTGTVDMEEFLRNYQVLILKVWIALEADIEDKVTRNPLAYHNFRNLIEYIKEKQPEMPEIDCSKVEPR